MTKKGSTKRALLLSALSLLLCVSMLVGSTFAWFTDSVTSAGNIIQSGTLDVDMVDADGKSMAGQVIEFVTADNRPQDQILWEPGCTYKTEPVYIVNNGNLALKYKMGINGIDGDAKLLEAIEWTVTIGTEEYKLSTLEGKLYPDGSTLGASKTDAIVLSGHMKEEAGNEYQGLTVEGISIAVYATQLTSESDSFDNQYDKMATIDDIDELTAALAADYDLITLGADITLSNTLTIPSGKTIAIDLAGYAIQQTKECTASYSMISNSGNLTILDSVGTGRITLNDTGANSGSSWGAYTIRNDGTLVVENGTIENIAPNSKGNTNNAIFSYAGSTTIKGGTFNVPYSRSVRQWQGTLTIEGGTFDGQVWVQAMADVTTTIRGGSFKPATHGNDGSSVFVTNNAHDVALTVTGGTFATRLGMTVAEKCVTGGTFGSINDNIVADGYCIADNGDNTWKVVSGMSPVAVQAALDNAADGAVIELTAGVHYGTLVMNPNAKNVTIKGAPGAIVGCINLNASEGTILTGITFDAAGAQPAYDAHKGGTLRSYANIIGASKGANNGAHNIVIDGCTFTGKFENAGAAIAFTDRSRTTSMTANVTVKNCVFDTENANYDIYGYYTGATGMTFTVENNTFASACRGCAIYLGRLKTSEGIVVKSNTFETKASLDTAVYIQGDTGYAPTLDEAGNTFGG